VGSQEVRVLIVDAQPLMRSGMRVALGHDAALTLVGDAGSIAAAVAEHPRADPEVVVLGAGHGLAAIREVREHWPEAALVMMTAGAEPTWVRRVFERGVAGVVLATASEDEFVRAVRTIVSGERYLTPAMGVTLARHGIPELTDRSPLSTREREVLRLLALGHTNQEIAQVLVISTRTVEGHRAHLAAKLEAPTRADLVRHALRHGLLDDELVRR
jgi:two-component system, NarL family, response regulator NreC